MADYRCIGCGRLILNNAIRQPPDDGLCAQCREVGPERSVLLNRWREKSIGEAEFRRRWEATPTMKHPTNDVREPDK